MDFITDFNGGEKVQRPDFACMAECNCVLQTLAIIIKVLKCKPSACF